MTKLQQESRITEQRQAFSSALAHFYAGLEPDTAAQTFLDACAGALIDAHDKGERLALPLKFVPAVNQ